MGRDGPCPEGAAGPTDGWTPRERGHRAPADRASLLSGRRSERPLPADRLRPGPSPQSALCAAAPSRCTPISGPVPAVSAPPITGTGESGAGVRHARLAPGLAILPDALGWSRAVTGVPAALPTLVWATSSGQPRVDVRIGSSEPGSRVFSRSNGFSRRSTPTGPGQHPGSDGTRRAPQQEGANLGPRSRRPPGGAAPSGLAAAVRT